MPLSSNMKGDCSQDYYYPFDGSMKTLISEEISKQKNTRRNTPSIVARLMGMESMETLSSDTNLHFKPVVKKNGNLGFNLPRKDGAEQGTVGHVSFNSKSTRQLNSEPLHQDYRRSDPNDSYPWLEEPKRREHPQEEELQKFKKEFEAWQAAQARKCSQIADIGNDPEYLISEADSDDEKLSFYANCYKTERDRHVEPMISYPMSHLGYGFQQENNLVELSAAKSNGTRKPVSKSWSTINGFKEVTVLNSDCNINKSSASMRIVILRPGPDLAANDNESRATSSSTIDDRNSIVDFLEEVKERLKSELHGRPLKRNTVVRGGGIETPFSEKISDSKYTGDHIAYNCRENIPSNVEKFMRRSESTRSYKNEIQLHGPSSPEFVSRDTRFLTDRYRNVLKKDIQVDSHALIRGSSLPSEFQTESGRFNLHKNVYQEKPKFWGNAKDLRELRNQNQSVRYGFNNDFMISKEQSPGCLIRSLSAPVSGTSFAKLLLEDRHIVTGVQIRRKHEQVNNGAVSVHRQRKERFNFREKVSTFRHNFTLRKKLFGKKLQTMKETNTLGHDFINDMMSGPSVMMNFDDRHENSTEVPPSPASVCSTINEDFWRPSSYTSPLSTPDRNSVDADSVPQVFREISSNLSDLRRELKQLASSERVDRSASEDLFTEDITDIKDPMEAYIRDLLVASGLYDRSANRHFISSDPKPINIGAFNEVEQKLENNQDFVKGQYENKIDHMAILDLLNEKLPSILMPSSTMSKLGREVTGYSTLPSPHGNRLLNMVLEIIHPYVHPPDDKSCYSLDNTVSKDLQTIPWARSVEKEVNYVGGELECWIVRDLVEEIVQDMYCVSRLI